MKVTRCEFVHNLPCEQVSNRLTELEAENAKLREELADVPKCEACEAMLDCDECLHANSSQKERRRLKAENSKLRELVRDLYWQLLSAYDPKELDEFIDRMRELGVEVDG